MDLILLLANMQNIFHRSLCDIAFLEKCIFLYVGQHFIHFPKYKMYRSVSKLYFYFFPRINFFNKKDEYFVI
jgi:hypothetical protein